MKVKSTNNGKKGGLLKGKPHYDKDGNSLGGIKAIVTDTKQIVELEGGEVIINKEASKKHWKELSEINQSAGDGVPILPPSKMKKWGELSKGIKAELEHSKTIKKIAKEDLTPKEGATLIAKDHLAESDKYYSELKKMESKFKSGGTLTEEDKKEIYKKWADLVNMSSSELKKFMDSEEGKKAGLSREQANKLGIHYGRESARWILKMKATPRSSWTPKMWEWANRQISFNSRMRGNEGALYDEKGNKTRKHLSLLIWGHNPKKYEQGGVTGDVFSIKDPEQFKQIITLYNNFSEKFNVDNYFLNDNSVVFLRKVKFTNTELKEMSKYISHLSKNQNFDIISDKQADISNGHFKFFLKDRVRYSQGGLMENEPPANFENKLWDELSDRYEEGGNVITYKQKYNKKYGYDLDESHSLEEIEKDTKVSIKGLQQIYNKGVGAYNTNPNSVRPNVKSAEQWAMARVYSAVMGGKTAEIDHVELKMKNGGRITCAKCKHSWHSHESEEHDTHVCHKCGHDNKQQIEVVDYKTIKNIDKVDKMENSDIFYNEDIFVSQRDYILGGFNSQELNKIKVVDDSSTLSFTKLETIFTDRLENAIETLKKEITINVLQSDSEANIEQDIYDNITNSLQTYLEIKANGISSSELAYQIKNHSAYITWSNKIKDRVDSYKDKLTYSINDVNINKKSMVTVNEAEELTYNATLEQMLEQLFNINQENNN